MVLAWNLSNIIDYCKNNITFIKFKQKLIEQIMGPSLQEESFKEHHLPYDVHPLLSEYHLISQCSLLVREVNHRVGLWHILVRCISL
jgi:hypothetical protein